MFLKDIKNRLVEFGPKSNLQLIIAYKNTDKSLLKRKIF